MKLDLKISEVAYYKLLEYVLPNDLPVLEYSDGICSITKRNASGENNGYEVGRLLMLIDDERIIEQVSGRILDHVDGNYIIRDIV